MYSRTCPIQLRTFIAGQQLLLSLLIVPVITAHVLVSSSIVVVAVVPVIDEKVNDWYLRRYKSAGNVYHNGTAVHAPIHSDESLKDGYGSRYQVETSCDKKKLIQNHHRTGSSWCGGDTCCCRRRMCRETPVIHSGVHGWTVDSVRHGNVEPQYYSGKIDDRIPMVSHQIKIPLAGSVRNIINNEVILKKNIFTTVLLKERRRKIDLRRED